ncbi:hypothetical protein WBQ88_06850 [Sphingopyxis sp. CCNWLW253]|uniref:tail fiber domain-containing protein n=1 Tax=unclassified Sphingopyxis TaxID=2614943 RepID=UPI003012A9CE
MPTLFFADLVRELCQDGGTGPLMPTGAVPGHRRFSGIVPVGDPFHYAIAGIAQPAQWEVGVGRIDDAGRLQRDSVAASSNAGDQVDFAPGLKTIALTVGAEWFAAQDAAGDGLADALAAKQPLSTTHAAVTTGAADDQLTVRRGAGWVNMPLSALAFRAGDGRYTLDGPLGVQNGTAAAPAISFAADPDTGLFRAAADAIGIATEGVERLRLSPSGHVGIGTTAPAVRLHVEASGAGDVARFGALSGQSLYLYADAAFTGLFNVAGAGASRDGMRIGSDFVTLDTNATERVRVDGAGNVGIGTASPGNSGGFNRQLQIQGDYPCLTLGGNVAARSYSLGINGGGEFAIWDNQAAAASMQIAAGTGAVTLRGSVLQLGALTGPQVVPTRISLDTSYANSPAPTNQQLKLNLVPVGATEGYGWTVDNLGRLWHYAGNSVGPTGGHIFATGNAARWQLVTAGHFQPVSDNVHSLGGAGNRTTVVYAATGTINTSDAREKTWRGAANAAELRAGRRIVAELGFYQWNDAIAAKSAADARYHFGVQAQRVWEIMADESLIDPIDAAGRPGATPYAFLCWDAWAEGDEAGDRFGIRPDQLALFLIAAQEARLAALEAAA